MRRRIWAICTLFLPLWAPNQLELKAWGDCFRILVRQSKASYRGRSKVSSFGRTLGLSGSRTSACQGLPGR